MAVSPLVSLQISEAERGEYWAIAGVRPFSLTIQLAAGGAGNVNQWWCRNLPGSGLIAVVEQVQFTAAAADDVFVAISQGDPSGLAGFTDTHHQFRDGRIFKGTGGSGVRFQTAQSPAGFPGTGGTLQRFPLSASFVCPAGGVPKFVAVLPPGTSVAVRGTAANVVQTCSFWGYERTMELSELNP